MECRELAPVPSRVGLALQYRKDRLTSPLKISSRSQITVGNNRLGKSLLELWVTSHFSSRLTATLNLCLIYFKIASELAILLEHMHKKFEINPTKIKGSCQSGRKMITHNFKSNLPLACSIILCRDRSK